MFDLRQRQNGRPLLVGHRGAMNVAPENTIVSFEAGLAGGADIIELDVQLTADHQVILFHDDDLKAKTGLNGTIGDYTADYLQTLDVGIWFDEQFAGTPMPLLDEVLTWSRDKGVTPMIELKHGPIFEPELDKAVVALIEDHGMVDNVIITSFDQFALQQVQALNPNIATSFIYVCRLLDPIAAVSGLSLAALSPATNYMTQDEVKRIQKAGFACSPGGWWWHYPTLLEWGVDTISSNDPASVVWT
jgi:glycerophosphoryl diester phosphodiesterase